MLETCFGYILIVVDMYPLFHNNQQQKQQIVTNQVTVNHQMRGGDLHILTGLGNTSKNKFFRSNPIKKYRRLITILLR